MYLNVSLKQNPKDTSYLLDFLKKIHVSFEKNQRYDVSFGFFLEDTLRYIKIH